jgi:hypothetical protein
MWIVAVAWVYVIGLLAVAQPSVVAGIMTFLGYCVLPLSILLYLTGGKARRARAAAQESRARTNDTSSDTSSDSSSSDDSSSASSSSSDD